MNLTCGCGFAVSHDNSEYAKSVYDEHECYEATVERPVRWHESVFSFDAVLVVLALGLGLSWVLEAVLS